MFLFFIGKGDAAKEVFQQLTSEDVDLLPRVLTQKVFDKVVGHREKFGCCGKTICQVRNRSFFGGGAVVGIIMWKEDEVTFNNEESFQTFRVVVFKHLEDLAAQSGTR